MEGSYAYRDGLEIAVIGMSVRLPGANTVDEYLHNLTQGIESVQRQDQSQWAASGAASEMTSAPNYVNVKTGLADAARFDAELFGYTGEEAYLMDPQMRVMHECVWELLESAGYDPGQYKGTIGIYAGGTPNPMWEAATLLGAGEGIWDNYKAGRTSQAYAKTLLHDKDLMSTRVAYKLNLRGPAITLFTSCSTSLVAVHLAGQSILAGECDIAVAGGISIGFPQKTGYFYEEGMIVSPDGYCRAYDAAASGTVFGDGAGLVLLKRLENAIEDGDNIHAIIKGSAINNDGNGRIGYLAPGADGQSEVISMALQMAEAEPESICYIEGHGSGTQVGDMIELEAMKAVFGQQKGERSIAIGSVKTNIGHLNSAAGAAGLIKVILSLKHKLLFPTLHYKEPSPSLAESPFHVNDELTALARNGRFPLRAGVSAFGAGGTNAHLIIEEPPPTERVELAVGGKHELLIVSAATESALTSRIAQLQNYLQRHPAASLADTAYTLALGRAPLTYRKTIVSASVEEAVRKLGSELEKTKPVQRLSKSNPPAISFLFSGQGAQYVGMGQELYNSQPVFREMIDEGCNVYQAKTGTDLKSIMYPSGNSDKGKRLEDTRYVQPALFLFEYALAKLLMSWGIKPALLIGYSLGEVVAASIAGVFSLKDAMTLFAARGELMAGTTAGRMLSVPLDAVSLREQLHDGLSLAIDNGASCVVSGTVEAIDAMHEALASRRILCTPILHGQAAHSHAMDPILPAMRKVLSALTLNRPSYPIVSNVTGALLTDEEAINPDYWVKQMRETVQFASCVRQLDPRHRHLCIEIGPGRDLSLLVHSLGEQMQWSRSQVVVVDPIRTHNAPAEELDFLYHRIGKLWVEGIPIHWESFYQDRGLYKLCLPTYPFEGKRYWLDEEQWLRSSNSPVGKPAGEDNAKKPDIRNWFYRHSWRYSPAAASPKPTERLRILYFHRQTLTWEQRLASRLAEKQHHVIEVIEGEQFACVRPSLYTMDPGKPDHYDQLFGGLRAEGFQPDDILHGWTLRPVSGVPQRSNRDAFRETQAIGLYSLLHIVQAMEKHGLDGEVGLSVMTVNLQLVTGEETICPEHAPLLSTVKIISQENAHLNCRCIDLSESYAGAGDDALDLIEAEIGYRGNDRNIAYRGKRRWISGFEPVMPEEVRPPRQPVFREGGTYLISGGLGDVGYELANYLAIRYKARIAIVGRTVLQAATKNDQDDRAGKSKRLRELQATGQQVLYFALDIGDAEALEQAVTVIEADMGPVSGVIHAAGLVGEDGIAVNRITTAQFERHFQSKVEGLFAIEQVFLKRPLDFILAISSLSNLLGGLGDVAYAAANSYVDHFVTMQNSRGRREWISVNWETWLLERERGLLSSAGTSGVKLGMSRLRYAMEPEEGLQTLELVHGLSDSGRIIVSSGNLINRASLWLQPAAPVSPSGGEDGRAAETARTGPMERPELWSEYVAPATAREQQLARMWKTYFRIEPIGIQDDFFELGGDSLKAVHMIGQIYKETGIHLPISDFFNKPFIQEVAATLEACEQSKPQVIGPAVLKEAYPLSSAQQRLYVLHQMRPLSIAYNEPVVLELVGELDRERLQHAVDTIIARHAAWRTSFELRDGQMVQMIHRHAHCKIEERVGDGTTSDPAILDFIRPFHLEEAPLVRAGLFTSGPDRAILVLDVHHMVTDGLSEAIITSELIQLYDGSELPPLVLEYKDYCQWQQNEWEQGLLDSHESYWMSTFQEPPDPLHLPYDYNRPVESDYSGGLCHIELDPVTARRLKSLAAEESATVFIVLLSAFAALLSKLGGSNELTIGTAVSGRTRPELEPLVGMFVNTLPLRLSCRGDQPFLQLLRLVKETFATALEHQEYPFEELVQRLALPRDATRNPLFDVMFVWQGIMASPNRLKELTFNPSTIEKKVSKFDLSFSGMELIDGSFRFSWEYRTDLFKPSTVELLAAQYVQLLAHIVQERDKPLRELSIMTSKERELLASFNDTAMPYPLEKLLHEPFIRTAQAHSSSIAVIHQGRRITYGELHARSNQVAHYLIDQGVRPDQHVLVLMERGIELVISLFGILKAGAAYVPLDPAYPAERIHYMMHHSNAEFLITRSELVPLVGEVRDDSRGAPKLLLWVEKTAEPIRAADGAGILSGVWDSYPVTTPDTEARSTNTAYMIYTSGSTGMPKGVAVSHRAIVNRIEWQQRQFHFTAADCAAQRTSVCFDVSVSELFTPLSFGATLCIVPDSVLQEPAELYDFLQVNEITMMQFVPTLLGTFVSYLKSQAVGQPSLALRWLLVSGEALPLALVQDWHRLFPDGPRVANLYGPTEAAVEVSCYVFDKGDERAPIGRPLANTQLYVLDETGTQCPVNVPGELYIGGVQLAEGYYRQPELTSQAFSVAYMPARAGERLYRTGDLACMRPDGQMDYLGRVDHQVKIRGYRIELEEIEHVLASHPAVHKAVAGVSSDGQQLEAYVKWATSLEVSREELRRFASSHLPQYMVPARFFRVDEFRLTGSGKLDRKNLAGTSLESDQEPDTARGGMEQKLAAVWRELLQLDDIRMNEHFFEMGGNSLLMIQLQRRMAEEHGIHEPVSTYLRFPTLRSLAAHLEEGAQAPAWQEAEQAHYAQAAKGKSRRQARKELMQEALYGKGEME